MTEHESVLPKTEQEKELYNELPGILLPWYEKNARDLPWRRTKDPYAIWLSEIMLQQTRVEVVKGYYLRFLKEYPTIETLAEARQEKLLKLWEGLGYYNRVRNMQKAAQLIVKENKGVFPSEYSELLTLAGIGEYTAGAIASFCFNEPVAAVDGNVLRVISRIMEDYDNVSKDVTKRKIKTSLERVYPRSRCGDFSQSLMELGAVVCLPTGEPKCKICPTRSFCRACKHDTWKDLPVKEKRKERKKEEKTVFILCSDGTIAVRKREMKGLLAKLWELPNISGSCSAEEALKQAENWGCQPKGIEKRLIRKHIFTHMEWRMTGYFLDCEKKADGFIWVTEEERKRSITLPTAFRQFLEKE